MKEQNNQKRKKDRDEVKKQPKHTRVEGYGIAVKVINGNIESALRLFKKIVKESGIMKDYRDIQEYKKPSQVRREIKQQAIRRNELEVEKFKEEDLF